MKELIECLKKNDGAGAMLVLESEANAFGFYRQVPEIVESLRKECFNQAYIFCAAIVKLLSEKEAKHGSEPRMEACMHTAMEIATDIMPENEMAAVNAMQVEVDKKWLHPTVFQQIAQVPFYFFDSDGLRAKYQLDGSWWRMPLI